ncbi:MAG: transketolase C-terminal domain-containing protein, partial [Syntrophomonadaceae bacterium]|nr:transketolase C-terminal domain-containing protein [Syntrophomonadaceae bacterium]
MGERRFLNGNQAVAYAIKYIQPEVIAAYPVTPQSPIIERISQFVAGGELDADFIRVESEHAALSACYGAACAGCRVFTATSSQGLAYMAEMLPYVSGSRFPVVMAVVNRAMAAPWTIWGDQQDAISMRDTGWIQLFVENAQEVFDTCLQAFRLAEDPEVLTPVMVNLDGFVLSHTDELVELPSPQEVSAYLPPYRAPYAVDFDSPATFCIGASPDIFISYKYQQQVAMDNALQKIPLLAGEFARRFGRDHGGLLKQYSCEDAEYILVTMGSFTGTARAVAEKLRAAGRKVGVLKVRSFRPFPLKEVAAALQHARAIGVLDRNFSHGNQGALFTEIKA